jgi:KDO2-lipid IV(A) lauroyltransferase
MTKFDAVRRRLDEYVQVQGREHLQAALDPGHGAVAITGLVGNWELIPAYCAAKGIPAALVARRIYDRRLNQMVVDFRQECGVQTISRESPKARVEIQKVLAAGGILTIPVEQESRRAPPPSVPFLGRVARTPIAAAAFAVRNQLPVVPVSAQRRPDGGHRVTFFAPIQPEVTEDRRRAVLNLTRRFNEHIESAIRRNPVESVW